MEFTDEQAKKLKTAYKNNESELLDVEAEWRLASESYEQGFNDALEYVFRVLGI